MQPRADSFRQHNGDMMGSPVTASIRSRSLICTQVSDEPTDFSARGLVRSADESGETRPIVFRGFVIQPIQFRFSGGLKNVRNSSMVTIRRVFGDRHGGRSYRAHRRAGVPAGHTSGQTNRVPAERLRLMVVSLKALLLGVKMIKLLLVAIISTCTPTSKMFRRAGGS